MRLKNTLDKLQQAQKKALVTFMVAGDGDTLKAMHQAAQSGADVIELGMPFTDPMADGPAIQLADLRALDNGMTLKKVLHLVQQFRNADNETPIVLMGYFNPVFSYGSENFARDAAQAGVDGVIIVDLPPEEEGEFLPQAKAAGLDFIRLITPQTDEARAAKLLHNASGFIYYVSIAGITGTKSAQSDEVRQKIAALRAHTTLPIFVGFGIRTADDAKNFAAASDGVIVGTAIVDKIAANEDISGFVNSLKTAMSH
jgi:tryptophan synthase alpha chain